MQHLGPGPSPDSPKGSFLSGWCDLIQGVYADPHNARRVITGFLWNFLPQPLLLQGLRNLTFFFFKGEKPQHEFQRIKVGAEAEKGLPPLANYEETKQKQRGLPAPPLQKAGRSVGDQTWPRYREH